MGLTSPAAAATPAATEFRAGRLDRLFATCFAGDYRTRLVGGADEPYYQPAASPGQFHQLYYRSDYFASALHEVAHWCIAGQRRRTLPDFGYWYAPDGRDAGQQLAFQAVEVKPQALEWLFSLACGYRFTVSVDNLDLQNGPAPGTSPFKRQILAQARAWQSSGLPHRAGLFFAALAGEFGTGLQLEDLRLQLTGLHG